MSTVTQQTCDVITTQPATGEPNTGEPVNRTDLSNQIAKNDQAFATEKEEGRRRKKDRSDDLEGLDDCDCNYDCGCDFDFDCGCDDFDCGCDSDCFGD